MLLGVYWYYGFPEGLYSFDFFTFQAGRGGHADGADDHRARAQLIRPAGRRASRGGSLPDGYLFGKAHDSLLHLDLGDYALTDYTFHVASELEQVLRQQQATFTTELLPAEAPLLRLAAPQDPTLPYSYGDGQFQAVSSAPRKHQAQLALMRLDCHLPLARQADLLAAIEALCVQFGLDVLYYFDRKIPPQVNLMVFFGNGRQGVSGQPLRYTDTAALKTAVLACLAKQGGQPQHLGDYPADWLRICTQSVS